MINFKLKMLQRAICEKDKSYVFVHLEFVTFFHALFNSFEILCLQFFCWFELCLWECYHVSQQYFVEQKPFGSLNNENK